MSLTEDRIRDALSARAGAPIAVPLPESARRRVRARQTGVAALLGSVAAGALALAVLAYGTVGALSPRPRSRVDPAADGYT